MDTSHNTDTNETSREYISTRGKHAARVTRRKRFGTRTGSDVAMAVARDCETKTSTSHGGKARHANRTVTHDALPTNDAMNASTLSKGKTGRHARRRQSPRMDAVKILSITTAAMMALSAGAVSSTSMASQPENTNTNFLNYSVSGGITPAASRSDARTPLSSTESKDTVDAVPSAPSKSDSPSSTGADSASNVPSVSTSLDGGSWSLGEDLHIPYSKSPEEKAADLMAEQTKKDIERLKKDGVGKYVTDTELTLTADTMKALNKVYAKNQPDGFNASHDTGDSGNAYPFSECTWWAYIRRHQLGLPAGSHLGDGRMWAGSAASLGYWVDSTPHVGDAISFNAGQDGADGYYGHVAVVENVFQYEGKTYIVTSESGHSFQGKHFSRILEDTGQYRYVHY